VEESRKEIFFLTAVYNRLVQTQQLRWGGDHVARGQGPPWMMIGIMIMKSVDPPSIRFHQPITERTEAMTTQKSLISVLNVCDNFRPHLSPEPLVPFLLTPKSRPPLGLLRPPVVAALRADNAWRSANGHPLAWDIPTTASSDGTNTNDAPSPPYIAFAPLLASGSPAARTHALAETLERWRANANKGDGDGAGAFAEVIGGSRWRSEWYDVYLAPGGALRTDDGRDPLTLVEVPTTSDSASGPESESSSGYGAYAFSMERSSCALFGVVTYGVHMTVYEQKGDADGEIPVRVWVPRRAATKPTCVCHVFFSTTPPPLFSLFVLLHLLTRALMRAYLSLLILSLFSFIAFSRACVKLPRYA
jgi:hypothetical protein